MASTSTENMEKSFGELKVSLNDQLTKENCNRLCDLFSFPPRVRDSILRSESPGSQLLEYCTERKIIEPGNVTKLWEALTKSKLVSVATLVHEYVLSHAQEVEDIKEGAVIPSDNESDDGSGCSDTQDVTFEEFLHAIGLKDVFPQHFELESFVKIKDVRLEKYETSIAKKFWQTLSSLDYRVRSSHFLRSIGDSSRLAKFSIRDFIFVVLHCSESFLRQDILEKLSSCHLAVPIILQGVNGSQPEFLLWSLRRIFKKWRESESTALEQQIIQVPVFTVSFMRIGDINEVSKSSILNRLLGDCQGNDSHPFFLTKYEDVSESQFSKGCVEAVWYLPMKVNASEKFKQISLFLNLRGDCSMFPEQTQFVCKASQYTIVLIADRNRGKFSKVCDQVIQNAEKFLFIIVRDDKRSVSPKRKKVKLDRNYMYVRSTANVDDIFETLSSKIMEHHNKLDSKSFTSLEKLTSLCGDHILVDENKDRFRKAREFAKSITKSIDPTDLSVYKNSTFRLQEKWLDWVAIDRERQRKDTPKQESVEIFRANIQRRKDDVRRQQVECGLSDTMEHFRQLLNEVKDNKDTLGYFLSYMQDDLCLLVENATKKHLKQIENYEIAMRELDELIKSKSTSHSSSESSCDAEMRWKTKRTDLKRLHKEENDRCRDKNIGLEHFIRELGQWHEAHMELGETKLNSEVMSLPDIAVSLLLNGHLLEIMDGDTGCVALSWITSVLDTLTQKLRDPRILVLCVVGAQSSGKSTFLNSMFGVKFPARAGRCTRGLFLRILEVEESHAEKLGFKYLFLVDSEGIRSIERNYSEEYRFDNELVTLALCISDVTILNIEGEHIGPETTGLLGIAAHALMRMKEVDIQSQCRIVQQRVSDITARERNKLTMNQILDTLDTATKEAAREEGYYNRYQEFSDIFALRLDEDLQFIPCLWTGSMSPPCQFYSEIVSKIKASILEEAKSKGTNQQFTLSTFTQRIRDVWLAIKDENFVLNFQDSVKAIDYNSMCMEVNKLVTDMRFEMMKNLNTWQRKIKDSRESEESLQLTFDKIQNECKYSLEVQKSTMVSSLKTYTTQHKRGYSLTKHLSFIEKHLDFTVAETEKDLLDVLGNDIASVKMQNDISAAVSNMRRKLRQDVKQEADQLRRTGRGTTRKERRTSEEIFCAKWDQWKQEIGKNFQPYSVSEERLEQQCESLLLSITRETSVSKEILKLTKEEGGPRRHVRNIEWMKYFPKKSMQNAEQWLQRNEHALEYVLQESMTELDENLCDKSFDANLFQFVLQNAFQRFSTPCLTSEPPSTMKAKLLLHACGKLVDIVIKQQKCFEEEHSFDKLFEKEKISLMKDFLSFLKEENQVEQAVECVRRYLTEWSSNIVVTHIKSQFQMLLTQNTLLDPQSRNVLMLQEMKEKSDIREYFKYCKSYSEYQKVWFLKRVIDMYKKTQGDKTCLHSQAEKMLQFIAKDICGVLKIATDKSNDDTKCSDKNEMFKTWVNLFVRELSSRQFPKCQELVSELYTYNISDLRQFESDLRKVLSTSSWENDGLRAIGIEPENLESVANFVKRKLRKEISSVLQMECTDQCPLCRAPCDNPLPPGPTHLHFSHTHLPRGITGARDPKTLRLLIDDCVNCVQSSSATYISPKDQLSRLCRDYKNEFPKWQIGTRWSWEGSPNLAFYWHSVMATFNDEIAKHYNCLPALIPHSWNKECSLQLSVVFQTNMRISVTVGETSSTTKSLKS